MECSKRRELRRTSSRAWVAMMSGVMSGFAVLISLFLIIERADGQATPEQSLAYLDRSADGKIDLQEYLNFQVTKIARFDTDGDAMLNKTEFRESLEGEGKRNARQSFEGFDREDEPGKLTRREFLGYHAFVFNRFIDADKDGFISMDEWSKLIGR